MYVIGHRGFPSEAPENTLPSFDLAIRAGADFVEADLRATRDGVIICIHDATLDRTTTGKGPVSEHTYREVAGLDAGSWFSPRYAGEHVPTLVELLSLAQGRAGLALDIKTPGIEERVLGQVESWGFEDDAIIVSDHLEVLTRVKRLNPRITLLAGMPSPSRKAVDAALAHGANIVSFYKRELTWDLASYAHRRGLLVNAWPIDNAQEAIAAAQAQADFLTANNPREARSALNAGP